MFWMIFRGDREPYHFQVRLLRNWSFHYSTYKFIGTLADFACMYAISTLLQFHDKVAISVVSILQMEASRNSTSVSMLFQFSP